MLRFASMSQGIEDESLIPPPPPDPGPIFAKTHLALVDTFLTISEVKSQHLTTLQRYVAFNIKNMVSEDSIQLYLKENPDLFRNYFSSLKYTYASIFDESELKLLIGFIRTEVGQKLVKNNATLLSKMEDSIQGFGFYIMNHILLHYDKIKIK